MSVVPSPWHSEGEEVSDVVLLDDDSASRVASSVEPSPRLVVVGDDGTATTKPSSSASTNASDASDDADPNGSHDQEVLEEAGSDYEPTYEETVAYARWLGIKPHEDARMMRIAKDGLRAKLPPDWKPCRTGDGQVYYFNFTTGESDWDHPCDGMFRAKVEAERLRAAEAPSPSSASEAVTDVPTPSSASVARRDGRDEDEEEGDEGENASTGGVVGVGVEERLGSTRSSGSFAHATPKPPERADGSERLASSAPITSGPLRIPSRQSPAPESGPRNVRTRGAPPPRRLRAGARSRRRCSSSWRISPSSRASGEAAAAGASPRGGRRLWRRPRGFGLEDAQAGGGGGHPRRHRHAAGGSRMPLPTAEKRSVLKHFDSTLDDSEMSAPPDFLPPATVPRRRAHGVNGGVDEEPLPARRQQQQQQPGSRGEEDAWCRRAGTGSGRGEGNDLVAEGEVDGGGGGAPPGRSRARGTMTRETTRGDRTRRGDAGTCARRRVHRGASRPTTENVRAEAAAAARRRRRCEAAPKSILPSAADDAGVRVQAAHDDERRRLRARIDALRTSDLSPRGSPRTRRSFVAAVTNLRLRRDGGG